MSSQRFSETLSVLLDVDADEMRRIDLLDIIDEPSEGKQDSAPKAE